MIIDLSMMVGLYIILRCLSFILRTGERKEHTIVIIFAVVVILAVIFSLVDIFSNASSVSNLQY